MKWNLGVTRKNDGTERDRGRWEPTNPPTAMPTVIRMMIYFFGSLLGDICIRVVCHVESKHVKLRSFVSLCRLRFSVEKRRALSLKRSIHQRHAADFVVSLAAIISCETLLPFSFFPSHPTFVPDTDTWPPKKMCIRSSIWRLMFEIGGASKARPSRGHILQQQQGSFSCHKKGKCPHKSCAWTRWRFSSAPPLCLSEYEFRQNILKSLHIPR